MLQMATRADIAVVSRTLSAASALVVERTLPDALSVVSVLSTRGFHVTVAETFAKANHHLSGHPPTVLVTEIRLGEYNGLQLVLRGKSLRPEMAAVVLSTVPDPVLQHDAEAMGATFVLKPVDDRELAAAVFRTIFQVTHGGVALTPIRPPYERRREDRRQQVATLVTPDRRQRERRRDLPTLLNLVRD
jgi:two-component system response regulator RegA